MANRSYDSFHVSGLEGHSFNRTTDHVIGAVLVLCVLVGLSGNISSLLFFSSRTKESFANVLYTVISAVDACTCALTIPISCSLLSGRKSVGMFLNSTLCGIWYAPFYFTLRFSQFMVLVMGVTRTLAILGLIRRFNRSAILAVCLVYAGYILIVETLSLGSGTTMFVFVPLVASCTETNSVDPPDWKYTVLVMNNLVNLILISIIVFVCFILSIVALARGSSPGDQDFRRASITITIFTAVFLVCNMPHFLAEILNNMFFLWIPSLGIGATRSPFFVWYFILLGYRVLIPINAALNPCVYLWRMEKFRGWILDCLSKSRT